jgi:hypothetical protein
MVLVVVAFAIGIFIDREWDVSWCFSFVLSWMCLISWFVVQKRQVVLRGPWLASFFDSRIQRDRLASTILLVGFVLASRSMELVSSE